MKPAWWNPDGVDGRDSYDSLNNHDSYDGYDGHSSYDSCNSLDGYNSLDDSTATTTTTEDYKKIKLISTQIHIFTMRDCNYIIFQSWWKYVAYSELEGAKWDFREISSSAHPLQ